MESDIKGAVYKNQRLEKFRRISEGFGSKQLNESAIKWNEEIKSNNTSIAIGDSNAYYYMNENNDIINI